MITAYLLGILTGFLNASLVFVLVNKYQTPIERAAKQARAAIKPKGKIISAEEDSINEWLAELPNVEDPTAQPSSRN